MRVTVPPGARLQNIEAFARKVAQPDEVDFELILPETYFAVHPMVVSAIAAAGLRAREAGGHVSVPKIPKTQSAQYLDRMGLFELLDVETPFDVSQREAAGRFVPLRTIKDSRSLSGFIADLVPLLHAKQPQEAEPIQYVMAELVRNTLEHSGMKPRAVVMAQVFPKSGAVGIGVADTGQGMKRSLARAHATSSDLEAVQLAMRPGITGKTKRIGGTSENAGAGLFFCKSLAYIARQYVVVYSGTGLFKLLLRREQERTVKVRAETDRATRHDQLPAWPGTLVGIDVGSDVYKTFSNFMRSMREHYDMDVKVQKKNKYKKKARFR